jgi:methylase of polypeptide subunit release factors
MWDPRYEPSRAEVLLSLLWDNYSQHLARALRLARVASGIPVDGGVLGFVAGLDVCIVMRYRFAGVTPKIRVVAVIEKPKSVFDFWGAIDHADPNARNELKAILASGHKIIFHRGVLTHVDRRVDLDVFGPSIDTLVMSEVIVRDLIQSQSEKKEVRRALEVGTGSGLLSCCIAQHLATLKELYCLDTDTRAIACTTRNMSTALSQPGVGRPEVTYETGSYKPKAFRNFDLVVCNPPYIPEPPDNQHLRSSSREYLKAVAGTDLLLSIVESLPNLLSSQGCLLLMLSSLCLRDIMPRIAGKFRMERPYGRAGIEVVFDVEAVLSSDYWRNWLVRERRLIAKNKRTYAHVLHPVWLYRS